VITVKKPANGAAKKNDPLFAAVGEFRDFSTALMTLAEHAPERMSLAQMLFFLLAGMADLRGTPATFSEIKEATGDTINRSLHTTYKILLDGARRSDRPKSAARGLNWLRREENPLDDREKLLRLTPQGREELRDLLDAMRGE